MKLDEFFKFKIGDTVKHVGRDVRVDDPTRFEMLFVAQRLIDQCPGGEQYFYTCRVLTEKGMGSDYIRFNEIELVEFDQAAESDLMKKAVYDNLKELERFKFKIEQEIKKEFEDKNKE